MTSLWKNKNYLYLVIGYMLSVFVDAVVFMVAVKQIEILSNDTSSYTFLYIFHFLPAALFSLWIGAWINKKKIRNVLRVTVIVRIVLLIVFLLLSGLSSSPLLYAFIFVESLLAAFILPSTDTLVTKLVKEEQRAHANGFVKLAFVLMQMVGYGVTTAAIKASVSLYTILGISLGLLLLSVLAISCIKLTETIAGNQQKLQQEMRDLFTYLKGKPDMRKLFGLFALAWLIASSIDLVILAYLTGRAHVSSENFGIFAIVVFLGMIVGAAFADKIYGKYSIRYIFAFPLLVYSATVLSMYLFSNWLYTLPFFLVGGMSLGLFEVCFTTYLQDHNDERYYTRIFSIQGMILSSMPLPGLLFLGVVIDYIGIGNAILLITLFLFGLAVIAFHSTFVQKAEDAAVSQSTTG